MPVQFRVEEEKEYGLTHKIGSIELDFGVRGPELERELRTAQEKFIRDMELRGMTLYKAPGLDNPTWIENPDGQYAAFYAIDWEGKKAPKDGLPKERERSLEDTDGRVEYRCVAIFWAPETTYEVLTSRADRLAKEKADRNPVSFAVPDGLVTK